MGRNFDSPFIPSDDGSRLGGFFSNSFMFARSFLVGPAGASLRANPPPSAGGAGSCAQYSGPCRGKSRELGPNDRSEPLNSFDFSHFLPSATPMGLSDETRCPHGTSQRAYTLLIRIEARS